MQPHGSGLHDGLWQDNSSSEDDDSYSNDEYTSSEVGSAPWLGNSFANLNDISITRNGNIPAMSYGKTPRYSDPTIYPPPTLPLPPATVPTGPNAGPSRSAGGHSSSENNPPPNKRRRATHLTFPPGQRISVRDYSSGIDPTLMLPPDQLIPELRKCRAEIEFRNKIIDHQYEQFQEEFKQKAVVHKAQVAQLEEEKAALLTEKKCMEEEIAGLENTLVVKVLELSEESGLVRGQLMAEQGKGAALQVELIKMAEEKEAIEEKFLGLENRWAEYQKAMTKFGDDVKDHLRMWMSEREGLLGKIAVLERGQEPSVEQGEVVE